MGLCATERLRDSDNRVDSSLACLPRLQVDARIWPNCRHVNFKDPSKSICRTHHIALPAAHRAPLSIELQQPPRQETLECVVQREGEDYLLDFQGREVWRCASDWVELNERDTYIIGNTSYRLCRYVQQNDYRQEELRAVSSTARIQSKTSLQDAPIKCRICFSSKETETNPFINPCNCSGSIEYLHMQCLSRWLFGDISAQTNFLSLESQKSQCEICKTNISESKAYSSIIASILSGEHLIAAPFVILQGQLRSKTGKQLKNYMILSFAQKKEYRIGRSQQADICDKTDPYVSRINSLIAQRQDRIYIKDNDSKHGTGVKVGHQLRLSPAHSSQNLLFLNANFEIKYILPK